MKKFVNNLFYICIAGTVLRFFLPEDYIVAVYSPTIFGWLWLLFFLPFTFVTFIIGGVFNYRDKEWKPIKWRTLVLGIVIFSYAVYWFYVVYQNGNL